MKSLAIYGGSFDPPHKGHRLLAENLAKACGAEKVFIVPTATSPFKSGANASCDDRLNMCRLTFGSDAFTVSDIEIKRGGKSYTFDTVSEFKALYPETKIYLFMGDDMFLCLDKWYKSEELLKLCTPVAACRTLDGATAKKMRDYAESVPFIRDSGYIICPAEPFPISSTEIRKAVYAGKSVDALVENGVADYIAEKELYAPYPDEKYIEIIRERLTPQRFEHSLCVAKSAKELAFKYGADPEKAYTAGLLHDCCKDMPKGEQLKYLLENGAALSNCEINSPKLYHAMCGAIFAKNELGVADDEIIEAIRCHTTGKKGMSILEKVLFIADFISADRTYPGVDEMRKKAAVSLEEAIIEGIGFTIKELVDAERPVHTDTVEAFNEAITGNR